MAPGDVLFYSLFMTKLAEIMGNAQNCVWCAWRIQIHVVKKIVFLTNKCVMWKGPAIWYWTKYSVIPSLVHKWRITSTTLKTSTRFITVTITDGFFPRFRKWLWHKNHGSCKTQEAKPRHQLKLQKIYVKIHAPTLRSVWEHVLSVSELLSLNVSNKSVWGCWFVYGYQDHSTDVHRQVAFVQRK